MACLWLVLWLVLSCIRSNSLHTAQLILQRCVYTCPTEGHHYRRFFWGRTAHLRSALEWVHPELDFGRYSHFHVIIWFSMGFIFYGKSSTSCGPISLLVSNSPRIKSRSQGFDNITAALITWQYLHIRHKLPWVLGWNTGMTLFPGNWQPQSDQTLSSRWLDPFPAHQSTHNHTILVQLPKWATNYYRFKDAI